MIVAAAIAFAGLYVSDAMAQSEHQIEGLATGQMLPLEERMRLCEDARELRSRFHSGDIHKLRVQCKEADKLFTVHVDGNDRIFSITLRKDIEEGISGELIAQMRANQVVQFGLPDIEKHKLPEGFTGEVWQYGWGESCFIDQDNDRITAGKGEEACLIIDTDLTASKKLLVEYLELTDRQLDPGSRSSSETDLEMYSTKKGVTKLDFSKKAKSNKDSKAETEQARSESTQTAASNVTPVVESSAVSETEPDCAALYTELKSRTTGDIAVCDLPWPEADIKQCKAPTSASSVNRPTSHVVVVLDASGSMAAKIGSQSKMSIAKSEIIDFLSALEDDVPVGLVVYGHRGDNTKQGKAESCGSYEWAVPVGSRHRNLESTVNQVQPTGWTPLGGTLAYLETQLASLVSSEDNDIASPVVYVVSDGKETCGGDPVNAARSLNSSGVHAAVNVIGFDVDEDTRAQLEAISAAGGGQYFPAKDSSALRKQLQAARDNEAALARYQYCINLNVGKAEVGFHNRKIEVTGCYLREADKKWQDVINNGIKAFSPEQEKSCGSEVRKMMRADYKIMRTWFIEDAREIRKRRKVASQKAYEDSVFKMSAPE